jgi:alpha-L-fucosidase
MKMNRVLVSLAFVAVISSAGAASRPAPRPALLERLDSESGDLIGIVHWGLNTYTDREWGYGDEDPKLLNPSAFDADQIVGACKTGGLGGLVIVAKHHDGFCLWPTKTTEHNISKSPFRGGEGDYVREMSDACRKAGLKFGVYVSPWDRNNAAYSTPTYVDLYHAQIKELLDGAYGPVFEMWFDGANGGDGYYGGAREARRIAEGYYRFDEVFGFVRKLQPKVCIFAGEEDDSDFRWPGNEQGILDPDSRATVCTVGGYADGKYGNPAYGKEINTGTIGGTNCFFRVCEADFPLRPGWFYHAREHGQTKTAAYLMKCYLRTVGNGGTMNLGIAPNRDGRLDDEDVKALAGFTALRKAFFAHEVKDLDKPFNVVVMSEDIAKGEQVDGWELAVNEKTVLSGKSIGRRRIRVLGAPASLKALHVRASSADGQPVNLSVRAYLVSESLLKLISSATSDGGETDTAKWMTGVQKEAK